MRSPSIRRNTGTIHLQTAPELVAQALRESIISGELKGGDRVLEQKWSLRLGVGQPTLREALLELEHQGLVIKRQQRGTYIAQMSPEAYQQILEVRIPLESIAIGKAALLLTTEQEKELVKLVDTMSHSDTNSAKVFHDCDVLFHRTIWEIAGNPYLAEVLETITFRLFVFSIVGRWNGNPSSAGERAAAVKQHQKILAGIRSKDANKARQMFVKSTVKYWNTQYKLKLKLADLLPDE